MATQSAPFLPRDVFRLLVRLEAQKTHDVDSATLERRFRVPAGYAKDETLEQRERKAQTITPGPGTYETPECWISTQPHASGPRASAAFASRAPRDPFQLEPLLKHSATSPRASTTEGRENGKLTTSLSVASVLDVPPPLGSFARADRGMLSTPTSSSTAGPSTTRCNGHPTGTGGVSFDRAPRATHVPIATPCALGPAQYAVQRLWDLSHVTGRATLGAPTPAVFSASKEKREVVWSPARALPSHSVADAWNSSPHYAKHKHRVERELLGRRPQQQQQQKALQRLTASASSPSLGTRHRKDVDGSRPLLDPFDWLRRQQPQGEQRANALAAKHGLVDLVRPLTATATAFAECAERATNAREDGHPQGVQRQQAVGEKPRHEDDEDDHIMGDASSRVPRPSSTSRGARISISCRLQGGLVVSVRLYAAKSIRQLKLAFLRRQTRYQHEDEFDLYLANGKPLMSLEETLAEAGVHDKTLVQVVSRA